MRRGARWGKKGAQRHPLQLPCVHKGAGFEAISPLIRDQKILFCLQMDYYFSSCIRASHNYGEDRGRASLWSYGPAIIHGGGCNGHY